jgi:hypothetical protein
MGSAFEAVHGDAIVGKLTTIDRLIINGHLMGLYPPGRFESLCRAKGSCSRTSGSTSLRLRRA